MIEVNVDLGACSPERGVCGRKRGYIITAPDIPWHSARMILWHSARI